MAGPDIDAADALLGAALVALLVLEWVAQQPFEAPWWAAALWAALLCVTLAVLRRRLLFALMVCGGLNLLVVLNQLVAPGAFPSSSNVSSGSSPSGNGCASGPASRRTCTTHSGTS